MVSVKSKLAGTIFAYLFVIWTSDLIRIILSYYEIKMFFREPLLKMYFFSLIIDFS